MATRESGHAGGRQARRHVVGPDHPDRRQPRHLHEDRLRQPRGRHVQGDLVAVPRLQRVHEGQGPARRRTSSPAASAASAATTTPSARATRRRWPTGSSRRRWASGSSTSARRPSTSSTTSSSRTTWCSWTSASRWSRETNPALLEKAEKTEAPHAERPRLPDDRRHHALLQPVHRARPTSEALADEPDRAGDDLPDGGAARAPLDDLPGRGRARWRRRRCSPTTCRGCCAAWTSSRRPWR